MGWKDEIRLIALILLFASIAAFSTGAWYPWLVLAILGYLVWHLFHLNRLNKSLIQRRKPSVFPTYGLWKQTFESLAGLWDKKHRQRLRLVAYLKELRATVRVLAEGVLTLDDALRIVWCSPSATKLLGIAFPENSGHNLRGVIQNPALGEYIERGDYLNPLMMRSPVDQVKMLSIKVMPVEADKQRYILHINDATQIYYLEQNKKDFIANVSHELRTPLTVISGYIETLQITRDKFDTDTKNMLSAMNVQTDRMQALINDLLSLSCMETSKEDISTETVTLSLVLEQVLEELQPLLEKSGHLLNMDVDTSLKIDASYSEIYSVVLNLIVNAIKHTLAGGYINIVWKREGDDAIFSVADSGEGIAQRHVPRITERFYRVDDGVSNKAPGTGLGLAIVDMVMNRHDGKLEITSELGKGSTFKCLFPRERIQ